MSDLRHTSKGFKWSICTVRQFHHFLNGETATCMYNSPHEEESLPRVLPGKLLSLDAQCRKDRGTSACFKVHIPSNIWPEVLTTAELSERRMTGSAPSCSVLTRARATACPTGPRPRAPAAGTTRQAGQPHSRTGGEHINLVAI